jgi:hypothetical protein
MSAARRLHRAALLIVSAHRSLLSISDEALLEETFAKIDTDGSGEIDLEEFSQGFAVLQEQISYTRKIEDNLRRESLAQEVGPHLHLHLAPRHRDDGGGRVFCTVCRHVRSGASQTRSVSV